MKAKLFGLVALIALACGTQAATASVLYDNGPFNGSIDAWNISQGFALSDSFTLSQASIVTGVVFSGEEAAGNTLTSVDFGITSMPNSYLDTGTATVSSTSIGLGFGFPATANMFSTGNVSLAAGTYYLVLQNAVLTNGGFYFWDEDDGPSSATSNNAGAIGSESFQILGTAEVSATPLPSTWFLMLSGFAGLGYFAYRWTKKNAAALATT